ncbi:MAG: UvrB/UvrC motif-containing protein [Pirellulales bacterium]|nr:UvrB/UvrC motif-containing protein [Pirellulales bacterium]
MSKDLSKILKGWDYDPNEVTVRTIRGDDGREKIQLRMDLGVLQMERDGRPDGSRPEGCESWLEYYLQRQGAHDEAHPDSAAFQLDEDDCVRLWGEGVQYYHRYLSFWHLKLYELCARDTQRNLQLFGFVCEYAKDDRHKLQFDQWRPYVRMMYTRSVATPLIEKKHYEEALQVIESGIDAIRDFLDEYQQSHRVEECAELMSLEHWRDEIVLKEQRARASRPQTAVQILRNKLEAAVAAEEFEEAARLRDEIRQLSDESV